MLNINRAEVIGNLTRDPELRYTPNGQAVCSFGLATNRRIRTAEGEWQNAEPEFHNIVVWRKLAEAVNQTLKKGDRIFAAGRIQTRTWEGQDGVRRQRTEIIADTIVGPDQTRKFSGPTEEVAEREEAVEEEVKEKPVSEKPAPKKTTKAKKEKKKEEPPEEEINLDDIPF